MAVQSYDMALKSQFWLSVIIFSGIFHYSRIMYNSRAEWANPAWWPDESNLTTYQLTEGGNQF